MADKKKLREYGILFAVLLALVFFGMSVNGYYFGELNQGQLLVFQKMVSDKQAYQKDLLYGIMPYFYTYFFWLSSMPAKLIGLENAYFALYALSMFLFYLAVFAIANYLFKRRYAAYLAVLLLVVNKPSIAVETIFPVFFPRVLAFPLALLSIYLFLKGRYALSFIIVGLSMNIHITSALHVFLMLSFCLAIKFKKFKLNRIFGYMILALVFALPVFLWSLKNPSVGLNPPQIWWDIIKLKFLHHLAPFWWSSFQWIRGGSFIAAFFLALSQKPKRDNHENIVSMIWAIVLMSILGTFFYYVIPIPALVTLTLWISWKFFTVFAMIYCANYILRIFESSTIAMKMASAGLFASLFLSNFKAILLFVLLILSLNSKKKFPSFCGIAAFFFLSLLSILGTLPTRIPYVYAFKVGFLPLIVITVSLLFAAAFDIAKKRKKSLANAIVLIGILSILLLTFCGALLIRKMQEFPRGSIYEHFMGGYEYDTQELAPVSSFGEILKMPNDSSRKIKSIPITLSSLQDFLSNPMDYINHNVDIPGKIEKSNWRVMQLWIHDNTGKDDVIITPPDLSDFRSYSQRAIVGEWEDLSMANYNAQIGAKIFERVTTLCRSRLIGECMENSCIETCRFGYNSLSENDFIKLSRKYGSQLIVVRKPKSLNFKVVYENDGYIVYRV